VPEGTNCCVFSARHGKEVAKLLELPDEVLRYGTCFPTLNAFELGRPNPGRRGIRLFMEGLEGFAGGGDGAVNVVIRVGGGDEQRFELRRWEENATRKHSAKEGGEARDV
jgi:hypothetical protein